MAISDVDQQLCAPSKMIIGYGKRNQRAQSGYDQLADVQTLGFKGVQ